MKTIISLAGFGVATIAGIVFLGSLVEGKWLQAAIFLTITVVAMVPITKLKRL